jgi:hypothetical protein
VSGKPRVDYQARDEGTLVLLWAITPEAKAWCDEYLPEDRTRWASATVIEARYWPAIEEGLAADGLVGRAA